MGWIDDIKGETIGLDTAPLIYFMEEHSKYIEAVQIFFDAMAKGDFVVVTSTVTLLEVMVYPLRSNNRELANEYRDILLHSQIETMEITNEVSEQAAKLRAIHDIRTPDAIQIGTALSANASFFFTNDAHLPAIPDIDYLTLDSIIIK